MEKRNLKLEKAGLAIPDVLAKHRLLLPYRMYQAKRDWKKSSASKLPNIHIY